MAAVQAWQSIIKEDAKTARDLHPNVDYDDCLFWLSVRLNLGTMHNNKIQHFLQCSSDADVNTQILKLGVGILTSEWLFQIKSSCAGVQNHHNKNCVNTYFLAPLYCCILNVTYISCVSCSGPCHKVAKQSWKSSNPWSRRGSDRMIRSPPEERLLWVFGSSEIRWRWCNVTDASGGFRRIRSVKQSTEQQSPNSSGERKHCAKSFACLMWTTQSRWNSFCTVH